MIAPEIAPPLREAYLKAIERKNREPRKNSEYTTQEINVLKKYKHIYRKATTTEERFELLQNHILVDIFNYWHDNGKVTPTIGVKGLASKIKVLKKSFMILKS